MLANAEEIRKQIGHRIRVRRVDRRMAQRELAEQIGGNQAQVSGWEMGRRVMRLEDAMAVAKVLGTTVGYLAGEQSQSA